MTKPKPYSQSRRIVRRYQVDVVRYVHRFPSLPEPRTSYQASVDMSRGPEEEPDSTFAPAVPTEEEAVQDALRIIGQRLLGREEVAKLRAMVKDCTVQIAEAVMAGDDPVPRVLTYDQLCRWQQITDALQVFIGPNSPGKRLRAAKGETKP